MHSQRETENDGKAGLRAGLGLIPRHVFLIQVSHTPYRNQETSSHTDRERARDLCLRTILAG